jgi:membrane protein DedA with SNARE-associated domain/rhodanese-related sulfurtransferase
MDGLVSAIAQHGYAILFAFVFLEVIGLPLPAAPILLIAGGASANGPLEPAASLATALSAMMLGDALMFLLGRYTGWWLLGVLCRLSISPESCILRSADAFYKRGRAVLVFAKFVPGISALAVPLAGSMRMRVPQFLAFDIAGACLYTLVYWGVGYLFSGFIGAITNGYAHFGDYAAWSVAVLVSGYLVYRAVLVLRERNSAAVVRVKAPEVARKLAGVGVALDGVGVAIYDVRSHGYYETDAMRIQGSARLEPNALNQEALQVPKDKEIVLYCTCVREATSVRVARVLAEQGYKVSVIAGGLRAWKKAGLPLEPVPQDDIVQLPTFS